MKQPDSDDFGVVHPVPSGLKSSGRRLWQSTVEDFELSEYELGLLREACRTLDAVDSLQRRINRDGVMHNSPQGMRAHPALVELRQQRICYARLIAQLALPSGEEPGAGAEAVAGMDAVRVKQRRATRGVYGIRGVVV